MKLTPLLAIIFITISVKINAQSNQAITGYGNPGYLPKLSNNYILNNSQLFDNGTNVGIGTATPSAKLEITNGTNGFKFDPITSSMTIFGGSNNLPTTPTINFNFKGDSNPGLSIMTYTHDNVAVLFDAYLNGTNWISSHAGSNFSLYKNNSELIVGYNAGIAVGSTFGNFNLTNGVRFGKNGTMGIGVSAGSAKLEVAGGAGKENIRISSLDGSGTRYLSSLNFDNPALSYHAYKDDGIQKATGEISFLDRPGTSGFANAVRSSDILLKTAHNWNGQSYGQYLDTTVAIRATQDGGYMGIGITVPQAKLDVNGTIFCRNYLYIGTPDLNTVSQIANYKLAVNGPAIFNKAVVKLYGNWADYVFAADYKLLPIADLEKFIQKNKHLPEIPCTSEVANNGIDLGDTQIKLLKKIEELTLYVIAQNKQLAAQGREMKQVKKEIALLKKK